MAEIGSKEWRENVREGSARGKKFWKLGLAALPRVYRSWLMGGKFTLDPQLRPVVAGNLRMLGELVEQRGGVDRLTAIDRLHLRSLLFALVGFDAHVAAYLETGDIALLERARSFTGETRTGLKALGLDANVADDALGDYQAALAAASASEAPTNGDRGADGRTGGDK